MFTRAITHQKHLAQSGHSTRSAVDIFNTLRVFTKEPIRGQEIKLECYEFYLYENKRFSQHKMLIVRLRLFIYTTL